MISGFWITGLWFVCDIIGAAFGIDRVGYFAHLGGSWRGWSVRLYWSERHGFEKSGGSVRWWRYWTSTSSDTVNPRNLTNSKDDNTGLNNNPGARCKIDK